MFIYDKENDLVEFKSEGLQDLPFMPSAITELGYHQFTKADGYLIEDIHRIVENGYKDVNPRPKYEDGTPAHTYSVNHRVRSYDLSRGEFPISTLRPVAWKTGIRELFTIYQKPTHVIKEMEELGVKWWNPWDIGDGTIGHRYGHTVSRYDLMNKLLNDIKNDPYGRRHIIDLWQEEEFKETTGLAPCAFLTIWNVRNDGAGCEFLDMMLVQRSGDMLTASGAGQVNEVQYATLLMMVARHTGYIPGVFTHVVTNEQIYDRHIEAAKELEDRYLATVKYNVSVFDKFYKSIKSSNKNIKLSSINPITMQLNPHKHNFFDFDINDFNIIGDYDPIKPNIKLPLGI